MYILYSFEEVENIEGRRYSREIFGVMPTEEWDYGNPVLNYCEEFASKEAALSEANEMMEMSSFGY